MPLYSYAGVRPRIAPGAFVHPDAVLIGDVRLGEDCVVGHNAHLARIDRAVAIYVENARRYPALLAEVQLSDCR